MSVVWVFSAPIVLSTKLFCTSVCNLDAVVCDRSSWRVCRRKRWKALPIVFLLMILGGHPQPALYAVLVAMICMFFYPRVSLFKNSRLAHSIIFSVVIGVVVFGPFLELVSRSTRSMMNASDVLGGVCIPHFSSMVNSEFLQSSSSGNVVGSLPGIISNKRMDIVDGLVL